MSRTLLSLLSITCILIVLLREIRSVEKNTGPAYHGCHFINQLIFDQANNKWLDTENMNIEMCIDHCDTNEQTLASLYNGSYCLCSEVFVPGMEAPELNCRTPCPGNMGERCGGPRAVSIYSVCDAIHYYKNCEYLCYCNKKMSCNFVTGVCLNGQCDFFHEGERCDIKRDAPFMKLAKAIIKTLQYIWQQIKGLFILEEKIPEVCEAGLYGVMCDVKCHCEAGIGCNRMTGVCSQGNCAYGWVGRRCDKPNSCDNSPCLNGGQCLMDGLKIACKCVSPYSGSTCEQVDPCSKTPCLHNGICTSKQGNFECECVGEYFGETCERDLRQSPSTHVYVSCFREVQKKREFQKRMAGINSNNMNPSICSQRCRVGSYTYAGLQFGNECWCANSVGLYGAIPKDECAQPCSGDKKQICGDSAANSVYAVCPVGRYNLDCKGVCNCLYYPCELKTGDCPEERCKVGFSGKRCDQATGEQVGLYEQQKMTVVLALAGYTAFVIIATVLFVLQHFRIIGRLPIAALNPEELTSSASSKNPKTDETKPKSEKKKSEGDKEKKSEGDKEKKSEGDKVKTSKGDKEKKAESVNSSSD